MGEPDPEGRTGRHPRRAGAGTRLGPRAGLPWKYRYPLFLAITIGAFNQLAGINAILYYLNSIFAAAGFSQISGDQQAIAIGFTNLVFTIVGMSLIDKLGRKTLLLIGAAGTASCLGGVAWLFRPTPTPARWCGCWSPILPSFRVSQGAVIWVYIGEVFPNQFAPRARAWATPATGS